MPGRAFLRTAAQLTSPEALELRKRICAIAHGSQVGKNEGETQRLFQYSDGVSFVVGADERDQTPYIRFERFDDSWRQLCSRHHLLKLLSKVCVCTARYRVRPDPDRPLLSCGHATVGGNVLYDRSGIEIIHVRRIGDVPGALHVWLDNPHVLPRLMPPPGKRDLSAYELLGALPLQLPGRKRRQRQLLRQWAALG